VIIKQITNNAPYTIIDNGNSPDLELIKNSDKYGSLKNNKVQKEPINFPII
jgi:hypothetical protein